MKCSNEYFVKTSYQLIIKTSKKKKMKLIVCWEWKFDDLWDVLDMSDDDRLWYNINAIDDTALVIDDENNYMLFVTWGKFRDQRQKIISIEMKQKIEDIAEDWDKEVVM